MSSTSADPSSSAEPTPEASTAAGDTPESVGEAFGGKIFFYAVAKEAGLTDMAAMDELANGICSRITAGEPTTVGPWMKETFNLEGDLAAKVAIVAVQATCPEHSSLFDS